jgi:hypothetical protein
MASSRETLPSAAYCCASRRTDSSGDRTGTPSSLAEPDKVVGSTADGVGLMSQAVGADNMPININNHVNQLNFIYKFLSTKIRHKYSERQKIPPHGKAGRPLWP